MLKNIDSLPSFAKIPVNVITGFLGSGKTSTILNIVKNKAKNERWAIIVNEFGEVAIDDSVFKSKTAGNDALYIRELPGGCMCCTAGISMQKALNTIINDIKPDRLFIEPTGLGHTKEILRILKFNTFKDKIIIQNVITILDARLVSLDFYAEHPIFLEHIQIADIIVGNKSDLYKETDKHALQRYLVNHAKNNVEIVMTQQGKIHSDYLDKENKINDRMPHQDLKQSIEPDDIKTKNDGNKLKSISLRFPSKKIFNKKKIVNFLSSLNVIRMKAVIITNEGCFHYNSVHDQFNSTKLSECYESKMTIIAVKINPEWEQKLTDCLKSV